MNVSYYTDVIVANATKTQAINIAHGNALGVEEVAKAEQHVIKQYTSAERESWSDV